MWVVSKTRLLAAMFRKFELQWPRAAWLALVIAAVVGAPGETQASPRIHALLVGNNSSFPFDQPSSTERKPLRYADDDAAAMFELLVANGASAQLLTLMDAETQRLFPGLAAHAALPTKAGLLAAVDRLIAAAAADQSSGQEVVVVLFYSGHGGMNYEGEPALALLDGGIERAFLYDEVLARIPARFVHLLVDACHAEAVVRPRDEAEVVRVSPSEAEQLLMRSTLDRFPHVGAILASTTQARAHEWDEIGHGVFSHELLSALRGAADVNRDQRLEYSEVAAFMSAANRGVIDPAARLDVITRPPTTHRRAPILQLDATPDNAALWITGVTGRRGKLRVVSVDGRTLITINGADDYVSDLLVPRDARIVTLGIEPAEAALAKTAGERIAFDSLDFVARRSRPRSLEQQLRQGLFASEFGRGYYSGFVDRSPEFIPVSFAATNVIHDAGPPNPAVSKGSGYTLIASLVASRPVASAGEVSTGGQLTLRASDGSGPFAGVEVIGVIDGSLYELSPTASVGWSLGMRHGAFMGWSSLSIGAGTIEQEVAHPTPQFGQRTEHLRSFVAQGTPGVGVALGYDTGLSLWAEAQLRARGYRKIDEGVTVVVDPAAWVGLGFSL